MRHLTAAALALAFGLSALTASAACPGAEHVSNPSTVASADQSPQSTKIQNPASSKSGG